MTVRKWFLLRLLRRSFNLFHVLRMMGSSSAGINQPISLSHHTPSVFVSRIGLDQHSRSPVQVSYQKSMFASHVLNDRNRRLSQEQREKCLIHLTLSKAEISWKNKQIHPSAWIREPYFYAFVVNMVGELFLRIKNVCYSYILVFNHGNISDTFQRKKNDHTHLPGIENPSIIRSNMLQEPQQRSLHT